MNHFDQIDFFKSEPSHAGGGFRQVELVDLLTVPDAWRLRPFWRFLEDGHRRFGLLDLVVEVGDPFV